MILWEALFSIILNLILSFIFLIVKKLASNAHKFLKIGQNQGISCTKIFLFKLMMFSFPSWLILLIKCVPLKLESFLIQFDFFDYVIKLITSKQYLNLLNKTNNKLELFQSELQHSRGQKHISEKYQEMC